LNHYDRLVEAVMASDVPWVLSHGEEHSANVIETPDGRWHLIDWDTVRLAPAERDLEGFVVDGAIEPEVLRA
jgi:spectinomycin phosphotransferase